MFIIRIKNTVLQFQLEEESLNNEKQYKNEDYMLKHNLPKMGGNDFVTLAISKTFIVQWR